MIKGTDDIKDILKFMNAPIDIELSYEKRNSKGYYFEYSIFTNKIISVIIKRHNKNHNENGPACIEFYNTGGFRSIYYYINNILHRFNGPAVIFYDLFGNIIFEQYCLKGLLHNSRGPALRDFINKKWFNKYYLNNKPLTLDNFFKRYNKIC